MIPIWHEGSILTPSPTERDEMFLCLTKDRDRLLSRIHGGYHLRSRRWLPPLSHGDQYIGPAYPTLIACSTFCATTSVGMFSRIHVRYRDLPYLDGSPEQRIWWYAGMGRHFRDDGRKTPFSSTYQSFASEHIRAPFDADLALKQMGFWLGPEWTRTATTMRLQSGA